MFRKEVTERVCIINHTFQGTKEGALEGWRLVTDWVTLGSAALACNTQGGSI